MGLYASSKHALEGLSESLDHEVRGFGVRVVLIEPSFTNTRLDTNVARTSAVIPAYAPALTRSAEALRRQVEGAPQPEAVGDLVAKVIGQLHRLRRPADGRARFLGFLRRFAPPSQVDKGLRATFGL